MATPAPRLPASVPMPAEREFTAGAVPSAPAGRNDGADAR